MRLNNTKNNGIEVLASGVASAPRILMRSGIGWILLGIGRWLDGLVWKFCIVFGDFKIGAT
jgi:hypothetical protein